MKSEFEIFLNKLIKIALINKNKIVIIKNKNNVSPNNPLSDAN